jgi:CheY-like chemotaxis protein
VDNRPRVIILNVTMPQMNGLTVCHELDACPQTAQIPVLMISGSAGREAAGR